ncbi:MAG: hypothetical protein WC456_02695 [Patescibacteria group bacterium]
MFKELKIDKVNYFLFFIFLTLVPIAIIQSLLEALYIKQILAQGLVPQTYHFLGVNSYLSPIVKSAMLLIGIVLGYSIGRKNWHLVASAQPAPVKAKKSKK